MDKSKLYESLYKNDIYITKHPLLHIRDSKWKVHGIIPYIKKIFSLEKWNTFNILDVGGGAGIIIKEIASHIKNNYKISVNKYLLDLSLETLEIQKKMNKDYKLALNENIKKTSLENKSIDLTLMMDVLEHIANPKEALKEIKRISGFVIFKIPLEDNLIFRIENFIKRGELRRFKINNYGHINFYSPKLIIHQIEENCGKIIDFSYPNVFKFVLNSPYYSKKQSFYERIKNFLSSLIYQISPQISSLINSNFILVLVKCN